MRFYFNLYQTFEIPYHNNVSIYLKVMPNSTPEKIHFKSNIFGSLGTGIFTPPNLIDFSKVFDNLPQKILENMPVIGTITAMLIVYFALLVVVRRKDKSDKDSVSAAKDGSNFKMSYNM